MRAAPSVKTSTVLSNGEGGSGQFGRTTLRWGLLGRLLDEVEDPHIRPPARIPGPIGQFAKREQLHTKASPLRWLAVGLRSVPEDHRSQAVRCGISAPRNGHRTYGPAGGRISHAGSDFDAAAGKFVDLMFKRLGQGGRGCQFVRQTFLSELN
jgi:hypothetical protein